ncbi:MAG: flagellar filament capping protein FliD [Lawsonibacter sp.]
MASISSLTGTSTSSSIYGTQNIISGLASGLDTETMIQNSVSGYQTKIATLQQQMQVFEWKQDAYRSIIDKMVSMTQKYTSYTSDTNLYSQSFFNKAVVTTTVGSNAAMVSATGKTSSEVQINAIKQLASAAKYSVSLEDTELNGSVAQLVDGNLVSTTAALNWSTPVSVSNISGTMTLTYGTKEISLSFGELDTYEDAAALAQGIRDKLGETYVTTSSGDYVKADTLIDVDVSDDGTVSFSDLTAAGNSVSISSASSNIEETLGFTSGTSVTSFTVSDGTTLSHEADMAEYLSGKSIRVTLDGVAKTIELPSLTDSTDPMADLVTGLNSALAQSFGTGKIAVGDQDGALTFTTAQGSTLAVSSDVGEQLGLGTYGLTSYLNTSKTLGDLFGDTFSEQELVINGVSLGTFGADTALENVITAINSNADADVNVSYSKITNQFVFTSTETGTAGQIDFGETDSLATQLFGSTYQVDGDGNFVTDGEGNKVYSDGFTAGVDAVFSATINGQTMELTRASNVVDLDGLSVSLLGTFGYEGDEVAVGTEAVTFTTTADSDKIISAIQAFVDDYNALMTELRSTYSTLPATKSDGSKYSPLTDDDKEDMTDSAIETYEEKAKQGILFGDSDLSTLYSRLRSAITPGGSDTTTLSKIGITTTYQDGLLTLNLDETTLTEALSTDPDSVRDIFTKTKESGSSTNGLIYNMKKTLDAYSSTSLAGTGILVRKAGTTYSSVSLLDNTLQSQMEDLSDEIEKWQDKMSDRVDYYTRQYTALEQLMSTMNSQSSLLSSLTSSY